MADTQQSSVRALRITAGMSQKRFCDYFHVPRRTLEAWELNQNKCSDYLLELMEYKLRKEHIIRDDDPIIDTDNEESAQ